jgi:hypothetical protein
MAHVSPGKPVRRNGSLLLLTLGLLLAAWMVEAIGSEKARRLDLSRWGSDIDLQESLAIDHNIARHYLPYISAVMVFDGLAFSALCWAGRRGRLRLFGGAIALGLLTSAAWHGINYLATLLLASPAHF